MNKEIIYTSAEAGLKKGSRGFCTVVSTAGMGANLAERLESMSGYRHAFALHDPNVAHNPVNYAHVTTRLAGQKLNVLSRIADAGQDYSGRTNKLAHHIVVDDPAALPSGPARILADPTAFVREWDGKVGTRPARSLTNPQMPESIPLTAWQKVAGDEGWAGHVAEQLLKSRAPVHVIFPAGTDTLALLMEVLDLVPVPNRWAITFSTYFTRLQAGTECQLRFVLDGTTEATALRNDARAKVIDLTTSLPAATGGALVQSARAGVLQQKAAEPVVKKSKSVAGPNQAPQAVSDDELESLLDGESSSASSPRSTRAARRPPVPAGALRPSSRLDEAFRRPASGRGTWLIGALVAVLLLALGGVGIWVVVQNTGGLPTVADLSAGATGSDSAEDAEKSPEPPPPAPPPFGGRGPFDEVGDDAKWTLSPLEDKDEASLQILVDDPAKLELEIVSEEKDNRVQVERASSAENGAAAWDVFVDRQAEKDPVAQLEASSVSEENGLTLTWKWSEGELSDDARRKGIYGLEGQTLVLSARANDESGTDEERRVERKVAIRIEPLFDGEKPFAKVELENDTSVLIWKAADAEAKPLPILAWSPLNLTIKETEFAADGLQIQHIPGPDTGTWEVSMKVGDDVPEKEGKEKQDATINLGKFEAQRKGAAGVELLWEWASGGTNQQAGVTAAQSHAGFLLRNRQFEVTACREDGVCQTLTLQFDIPAPPVFVESKPNFGDQWLLPLPNPLRVQHQSLPNEQTSELVATSRWPALRLWDRQSVNLRLHADFSRLIKTPGRTLQLVKDNVEDTGKAMAWTATMLEGDQPPFELGRYTLSPTVPDGPEYQLEFSWLKDFSEQSPNEVAVTELLRWCPLIVSVGDEDVAQRVYLQRKPDYWLIPPWGRQNGFVMEQGNNPDANRTYQEFTELNLSGGNDARFTVAFSVPGDSGEIVKTEFTKELKAADAGTKNGNGKDEVKIFHTAWFLLHELTNLHEVATDHDGPLPGPYNGRLPGPREEIGIFDTTISLPNESSEHPAFRFKTDAWVQFDLPLFGRWKEAAPQGRWKQKDALAPGKVKPHRELLQAWGARGGKGPENQGQLGPISLRAFKQEIAKQEATLRSLKREFEKAAETARSSEEQVAAKAPSQLTDEEKKQRQKAIERIEELNRFQVELDNLIKKSLGPDGLFERAIEKAQKLQEQLNKVTMRLKLAKTLAANNGDPEVTVVFIDAQMEKQPTDAKPDVGTQENNE